MNHFAKVLDGKVIQTIVVEPAFFDTFIDPLPGQWIETSYNTRGGVHYGANGQPDNEVALRANYAEIGYNYDAVNDVFYPPQPFPSWVLSSTTWLWDVPVAQPDDGRNYVWDETTVSWVLMETP